MFCSSSNLPNFKDKIIFYYIPITETLNQAYFLSTLFLLLYD